MPRFSASAIVFPLLGVPPAFAADLIKADNPRELVSAGSYTNAHAGPTNADWIVFDGTFADTTAPIPTGGSVVTLGLLVVDPANDVTISLANATCSIGANNQKSGVIDLPASDSKKGLTFNGAGASGLLRFFGGAPTLSVSAGRALTINTPVCVYNIGGGDLVVSGRGAVNLNGPVKDGDPATSRTTRVVHAGPGTLALRGCNTYTGGTSAGLGTIEIARDFTMCGANGIGVDAASSSHGTISFAGSALTLGGSLRIEITGAFATDATFHLIRAGSRSAMKGGFLSVSVAGAYEAGLTGRGPGLWSGVSKGAAFTFDETTGVLKVVVLQHPPFAG